MSTPVTVLDELFDPAKGWPFSSAELPLQRLLAPEGSPYFSHPYYVATVDGISIEVCEQNHWRDDVSRKTPAGRLVAMTAFEGITITNPESLLVANYDMTGLPSLGLDRQGRPTLQAAFPYASEIPLDVVRKQLMVCIGLVAEQARELLQAWHKNSATWQTAEAIASVAGAVAGALLRAFADDGPYRVDPQTGVLQEQGILGWKDRDERIDPATGKLQVRGIFGWKDR